MLIPINRDEWKSFFKRTPTAPFFLSAEWASLWESYYPSFHVYPLSTTLPSGKRVIIPLTRQTAFAGMAHIFHSSPAGTYGGWLSEDGQPLGIEEASYLINTVTKSHSSLFFRLSPFLFSEPPNETINDLISQPEIKASISDEYSYVLDTVVGMDHIKKSWLGKNGVMRKVMKAENSGVRVRVSRSNDDINRFYNLYLANTESWSPPPGHIYTIAFLKQLFNKTENAQLWIAEYQSRIVAGAIILKGNNHWSYWLGATDRSFGKLRASNLLHCKIIEQLCSESIRWYDFNPSSHLKGVERFKESFGAKKTYAPLLLKKNRRQMILEQASRWLNLWRHRK